MLNMNMDMDDGEESNIETSYDYLYFMSDDMRLVANICEDIFSGDGLLAIQHPYVHTNRPGEMSYPYERDNLNSMAFIEYERQFENEYFVSSFFGGNTIEMLRLLLTCDEYLKRDKQMLNGYVAKHGDESYLNRLNT